MLRNGLLISTAMTAVALLLSGVDAAQAQTGMHVADRDANARFLCTYGHFAVFSDFGEGNSFSRSGFVWRHVAVPITGNGQTVSRIRVVAVQGPNTSTSAFSVGIYSNSPSGLPGSPIAVGTGKAGLACGPVRISITPTTLKSNTKYWIMETISTNRCRASIRAGSDANRREIHPSQCNQFANVYWKADPNTKRRAYVQHHYQSSSSGYVNSSYTSPWTKEKKGPYLTLK